MSEIGPHDTLHLEWIVHICLRHIWGTYPQWQLNKITKKVTPRVTKFFMYMYGRLFHSVKGFRFALRVTEKCDVL